MQEFFEDFANRISTNFIDNNGWQAFLSGLGVTLSITIGAAVLGCIIGVLIAIAKVYHVKSKKAKWLDVICSVYLTIIRGTPVVVQLMIMYFVILVNVDSVMVAVLAFGINSGAYVAEIIRAGIMSIDSGQTEAGRSLGLSSFTTMRKIVLPQAIKNILPALGNECITLLKETSVVGYIAIMDITRVAMNIRSRTADPFFTLIFIALVYLVLVMLLTKLFNILEKRLAKSDRG